MKTLLIILSFCLLGCGCSKQRHTMGDQILQWIPFGTSLESARQIMEQHQFTCTLVSYDRVEQMTNNPDAVLWKTMVVRNDQRFAVTNVSYLECKKEQWDYTLTLVNGETRALTGGGPNL